jgi:plasmid stabilization system protein ParE
VTGGRIWIVQRTAAAAADFAAIVQWTAEHFGAEQAGLYAETMLAALVALRGGPMRSASKDARKSAKTFAPSTSLAASDADGMSSCFEFTPVPIHRASRYCAFFTTRWTWRGMCRAVRESRDDAGKRVTTNEKTHSGPIYSYEA